VRLIPASLFGRLTLILLVGLAVAQGSTMWLHRSDRQMLLFHARMQQLADRAAATVPALDAAAPDARPAILAKAQADGLTAALVSADQVGDASPPVPIAATLAQRLGPERPVRTGAEPGHDVHGNPETNRMDVRLRDGQWVRFTLASPSSGTVWPDQFVGHMLLTLAAVVAISLLVVRQATRPLGHLADAADALGQNLDAPPLPVAGPVETQRAARAFNGMQERLRRLVAERGRALAAVSHDLRTPLTRLRLRADLIEDAALRRHIERDIDEMQSMIDATLQYLRDLRDSEAPRPIDMNALLESLAEDERSLGRDVTVTGQAMSPYFGRLLALKRAVGNLVNNAVKYAGAAQMRIEDSPDHMQLIVEDEGRGMAPEDLARATEPYFRVDESRSRETGGVGLGLAIAKDIAALHGGSLELTNRPGGGLRATLTLARGLPS
jgi:signal transduction histidine kinase